MKNFRSIVDRSVDSYFVFTKDGSIVYANDAAVEEVGFTKPELLSMQIQEMEPLFDLKKFDSYFDADAKTTARTETIHKHKDGSVHPVEITVTPLEQEDERCLAISSRDISERKLQEKESREALARATETNRVKDEFLATVSHELRTPLTSILGWARMLMKQNLTAEMSQKALDSIERNAKAQAQLIEDLLDVSRIVTGKFRLKHELFELTTATAAAIESIRPVAETKQIQIVSSIPSEPLWIKGDPQRLQQVIWNLMSNSVKFTEPSGTVTLEVTHQGNHAIIAVKDTGKGMSQEFLPHVFERFKQAEATMAHTHAGLGLGLAIVRHIVDLHDGMIKADSEGIGLGSSFTVELPLASRDEVNDRAVPKTREIAVDLQKKRVLVLDDELDTCEMLEFALSQANADVKTAQHPQQAYDLIREWKPDIFISDIAMPEEDGYSLLQRIRNLPQEEGGNIPAIALTAFAGIEDRLRSQSAGFKYHLAKPIDPMELIDVIASLITK